MNHRETIIEANRQISLLIQTVPAEEGQRLEKYLRPLPPLSPRSSADPVHIREILPGVMDNIHKYCQGGVAV